MLLKNFLLIRSKKNVNELFKTEHQLLDLTLIMFNNKTTTIKTQFLLLTENGGKHTLVFYF